MIKDLTPLTRPIIDIYDEIEMDLIEEIAKRFDTYDEIGGSLEWQTNKLDEMGSLHADSVKVIAEKSKRAESEIRKMLSEAGFANIDRPMLDEAFRSGAIAVDPAVIMMNPVLRSTLEDSYKELSAAYKMIQTKALESVNEEYMSVINRAYVEVSSGVYDYNTSIKRALARMADRGITGATYERQNGQIVRYSLEAAVRRDTLTAVHQTANRNSERLSKELGVEYVEVSQHAGARVSKISHIANHAWWQGKVFKIEGFDEHYGNLKANTGYPDDIQGLGGVNCRHRMYPFIPGTSRPQAASYDEEKAEREYKATQQLRAKERRIRGLKKRIVALNAAGYPTTELGAKLKDAYADAQKFAKDNDLAYDWNRTQITAEAAGDRKVESVIRASMKNPKPTLTNAAGKPIIERKRVSLTDGPPGGIIQVINKKGGKDRTFYDADGVAYIQISNNGHGHKTSEKLGKHGEHAHDYEKNADGEVIRSSPRELTDEEREENKDFL